MANNCPTKKKILVFKSPSMRSKILLAMLGQFQEKTFSSNFKPYYYANCEVKVLEIFPHLQMFVSKFSPLGFQIRNFFIAQ